MKALLFCGDKSIFGLAILEAFLQSEFNIVGVVLPTLHKWYALLEKKSGQKFGASFVSKQKAKMLLKRCISQTLLSQIPAVYRKTVNAEVILKKHRVPYWHVDDVNAKEQLNRFKAIAPDLILCAGYLQIFSKELLAIPKQGAVNFHPSLLPQFRGPTPFFWIIATGETESGLTAHYMTKEIDAGDIIAQIKFPIPDFSFDKLVRKAMDETPNLIRQMYSFFLEGKQTPQKQDESRASYYPYDRESDHRILWRSQDIHQIYNLTRTGRAFCLFNTQKVRITKCSISNMHLNLDTKKPVEEGTVVNVSAHSVQVKALGGSIFVQEVAYKGRKMSAHKFIRRLPIQIGAQFS
jgi:methionyl-tRNA formyltransferase